MVEMTGKDSSLKINHYNCCQRQQHSPSAVCTRQSCHTIASLWQPAVAKWFASKGPFFWVSRIIALHLQYFPGAEMR
jgi:hypothetical protein